MDARARIEKLEDENYGLRLRIRELEAALMVPWKAPEEWQLTPTEARVFKALAARAFLTKTALFTIVWACDNADVPSQKIIDAYISKLRRKLKPFGIKIWTRWGEGYFLDEAQRNDLQQRLAA